MAHLADMIDLDRYPLHDLDTARGSELIRSCRAELASTGMFNLEGFLCPEALAISLAGLAPLIERASFLHERQHNIYFLNSMAGLADDHPALKRSNSAHRTICADRFADNLICRLYEWPPLLAFIQQATEQTALYPMADPLARLNVMSYRDGQGLGWHFDRSVFTTTLLLQAPDAGGMFEYRTDLRSDDDPNYRGVGRMLTGADDQVRQLPVSAGTLNLFKGRNTAHRVTPVSGHTDRIVAVFSYCRQPDVLFSPEERIGFYGRAA
jgi:hypothetical protein